MQSNMPAISHKMRSRMEVGSMRRACPSRAHPGMRAVVAGASWLRFSRAWFVAGILEGMRGSD